MLAYDYAVEPPQEPHPPQRLRLSRRGYAPAVSENDLLAGPFCQPSTLDSGLQLEKNSFF